MSKWRQEIPTPHPYQNVLLVGDLTRPQWVQPASPTHMHTLLVHRFIILAHEYGTMSFWENLQLEPSNTSCFSIKTICQLWSLHQSNIWLSSFFYHLEMLKVEIVFLMHCPCIILFQISMMALLLLLHDLYSLPSDFCLCNENTTAPLYTLGCIKSQYQ